MSKYKIGMLVDLLFDIQCPNRTIPKGTTVKIVNILKCYYIVTYDSCTFVVQENDINYGGVGALDAGYA